MAELTDKSLREERRLINEALMAIMKIKANFPWADTGPLYDQLGSKRRAIDALLGNPSD